ncbi:hypothetical protein [Actinoplanes sp. ATCC 53533]|nr:hypothetical protein [Actinoplanes sp. ATCC 53533]
MIYPALRDAGDEERRHVVTSAVDRLAHGGDPAVEIDDDLHVPP